MGEGLRPGLAPLAFAATK
jgi:hypothetical protein